MRNRDIFSCKSERKRPLGRYGRSRKIVLGIILRNGCGGGD
jgi:hypothetical protein